MTTTSLDQMGPGAAAKPAAMLRRKDPVDAAGCGSAPRRGVRRLLLDVEGDPVGRRRRDVSVGRSSSADVSAIAGTWRSVDDNQLLFCKVGTVIRTDGAPTTTGSTTCDYPLAWNVVNRLDVDAGGKLSLSFVHPDLAGGGAKPPTA